MGKNSVTSKTKTDFAPAEVGLVVFLCRRLPANEKFEYLSALCVSVVDIFL
jgi:hypothetical protein